MSSGDTRIGSLVHRTTKIKFEFLFVWNFELSVQAFDTGPTTLRVVNLVIGGMSVDDASAQILAQGNRFSLYLRHLASAHVR